MVKGPAASIVTKRAPMGGAGSGVMVVFSNRDRFRRRKPSFLNEPVSKLVECDTDYLGVICEAEDSLGSPQ